ncbi:alpha/beta-hydrolase, partial [Neolentinus lepideus HHB14362 ss-1]
MSSTILKLVYTIGGLVVNVYEEPLVRSSDADPVVLFFLHGRTQSAAHLEPAVQGIFEGIGARREANASLRPLIIVTFDQRNHGTRLVDPKANEAWNHKIADKHNARHAIDMYSMQTGTAKDVSFLIDFLPAYLFPHGERTVKEWTVAGISLGGHATWIALKNDKRISTGIPVIGCPDYLALMCDRAIITNTPFEPPHVPDTLLQLIYSQDPVFTAYTSSSPAENPYLNKKILVVSGKEDKLVPWTASQGFVEKLEVGQGKKEVFLQEGAGHEWTKEMLARTVQFL